MAFVLAVVVVTCVFVALWIYARWEHGRLEKMGVPIVKHHPLLGSARETYEQVGGLHDCIWREKYGDIFGVYEGRQAQLFVCVPELIRLICVKDSSYFDSKRPLDFQDPVLDEMPDFQPLEKWRLLRSLATPAFTSAKIKMMNLPMKDSTMDFIEDIRKKVKAGNGIHKGLAIDTSIHSMLTDLICRCVFSIKIGAQTTDNELAKIVHEMVTPAQDYQPTKLQKELILWTHVFPFIKKIVSAPIFKPEPVQRFTILFRQLLNERRKSGQKYNDVVDMCVEWMDKLDTPEFKSAQISELSIMCQALVFFFAAQDQVSTQIAGVIYHMTQDPEIAEKVTEEVDAVFAKHNGKIEHEHLSEFVYLNACISESLRLYPFFHRVERVCTKDWSNEEYGLYIKKGMPIMIPLWAVNRNPEHHENPDKFDPERYMPENKDRLNPYSSTSFGHGPRNCTGKLFANEAMTLIAALLIKNLKFSGNKDTKMEFLPGGPFFAPHNSVLVDVQVR